MSMYMNGRYFKITHPPRSFFVEGNPVTFKTKYKLPIKSLKVNFNPVQDLHGYDTPWPGGGGKNKLQITASSATVNGITFTVKSDGTVTANGTATAESVLVLTTTINTGAGTFTVSGAPGGTNSTYYLQFRVDGSWRNCYESYTWDNIKTGITGVLIDIKSGITMNNYVFKPQLEAGSTATSFAPYSNICPISGWTGANVERTGKNLFDKTVTNGYVKIDNVKVGATYTATAKRIDTSANTYCYIQRAVSDTTNRENIGYVIASGTERAITFTVEDGYDYYVWCNASYTNVKEVQIELGSAATAYEPYHGSTTPISWADEAGTVYGGYLEWLRDGTVKVTKTMASVDMGDLTWTYRSANTVFSASKSDMPLNSLMICTCYTYNGSAVRVDLIGDKQIWNKTNAYGTHNICVKDTTYTDAAPFKTSVTGQKIVYTLATPQTYTLTPTEALTLLQGTNTIWSDTNGNLEVTYESYTNEQ